MIRDSFSSLRTDGNPWLEVADGDPRAAALYARHYSARKSRRREDRRIAGPGRKMVLLTPDCAALFVWRQFRSLDRQEGLSAACFRNEGGLLSSWLIRQAEVLAQRKWPGETRFYTYVNPQRVRSPNPGYCFKMAGYQACGKTVRGLIILEKRRNGRCPDAAASPS